MAIELDTSSPLKLSVFDANRNLIAVSNDATFFTGGTTTGNLETQDLRTGFDTVCFGPCVQIPNVDRSSERYYIQIESSTSGTFSLFAYANPYQDLSEPAGQDDCDVTIAAAGEAEEFALETLGDVDCVLSDGAENRVILATNADTAIAVKADVYDGTSLIATLNAGPEVESDTFTIVGPAKSLRVLVRSSDGRAGPSKNSQYSITFNTP
jgi:hypothetical protein